ncbi:MAG: aldo/keto reductase [Acidimicrobiia bacterium]|nr:aldo/keto reductase [Acidimicrobiia bacterium]
MTLDISGSRTLGVLGDVGPLAFGHWRFVGHDVADATRLLETALEAGMTLVDTADVYGLDWGGTAFGQAEELLGEVLAANPRLRDEIVLATKGGILPPVPYDSSPGRLRTALDDSLRRLQTDRIDLYQIHRPDMYTHPADVAATLDGFIDSGKVRAVGVSNHTPAQTDALVAHLRHPLTTIQPQYSVAHLDPQRDGTFDLAMRIGATPLAWSPLGGGGIVTGEGIRTDLGVVLDRIAGREGVDRAAVALAFVLAHPSRPIAIVGSQNPERLRSSVDALGVELSRQDVYDLVQASEGRPLP